MKVVELSALTSLLALLACNGGSPQPSGCSSSDQCASGLICVVPSTGPGTCTAAPFAIQLAAPAQGAQVGSAGVDVQVVVTKADASGPAPTSVALVVDRAEVGSMALESQDGVTLRYRATYVPPPGVVRSAVIAAVAKTAAGSIASSGAIVSLDTKPPVLDSPVATCGTLAPCTRDGDLALVVSLTDDHPVTVTATLDLPGPAVPLAFTGVGTSYRTDVRLAQYAFPSFTGSATATVTATDSFGNTASITMASVAVTRLRWVYDAVTAGTPVTGPAVNSDGSVIVGVANGTANLRAVGTDGKEVWRTAAGASTITAAPSIGTSVYAASNDGKLYARDLATGFFAVTCPSVTPPTGALFTPAVLPAPETAFTAGAAANLYGARPGAPASCLPTTSTGDPVSTSAVIVVGKAFAATVNGIGAATVRSFNADLSAGPTVSPSDGPVSCNRIDGPLAADGGNVLMACGNGHIFSADAATLATKRLASLSGAALESPVLFPNGDILVGTNDRKLHRLAPLPGGTGNWIDAWSPVPDLGAPVTGEAIVSPDGAGVVAYAVTAAGTLHAVDAAGKTVWTTATEVTPPLGAVALSFPAVAPATAVDGLPTLYVGSADGKLYAVIVDSGLDPTSPWPKSHHDLRNTGNAAAPLP